MSPSLFIAATIRASPAAARCVTPLRSRRSSAGGVAVSCLNWSATTGAVAMSSSPARCATQTSDRGLLVVHRTGRGPFASGDGRGLSGIRLLLVRALLGACLLAPGIAPPVPADLVVLLGVLGAVGVVALLGLLAVVGALLLLLFVRLAAVRVLGLIGAAVVGLLLRGLGAVGGVVAVAGRGWWAAVLTGSSRRRHGAVCRVRRAPCRARPGRTREGCCRCLPGNGA